MNENIRLLRKTKNMSQSKLARLSGISGDYMNRIELGKVKNIGLEKLTNIAKALDVELVALFQTSKMPAEWKALSEEQRKLLFLFATLENDQGIGKFLNLWPQLSAKQRELLFLIAEELTWFVEIPSVARTLVNTKVTKITSKAF
ncbi:helix-turn-helix domain-containing protein [bacterium]|nr:helix-turn-helix domain-containing protein [bacterium]